MKLRFEAGRIYTEPVKLRQFFYDWRFDSIYGSSRPPFPLKTPFMVVQQNPDFVHFIIEPETVVFGYNNYGYIGGGSHYGGCYYYRLPISTLGLTERKKTPNYNAGWRVRISARQLDNLVKRDLPAGIRESRLKRWKKFATLSIEDEVANTYAMEKIGSCELPILHTLM